jgi:hypothetical protein
MPSAGTHYFVIRYRQNNNLYHKIFDNPIVNNQYQSITVNWFSIGRFFMLNPVKIQTEKSSDFHNIRFEIFDIDGNIITFLSHFDVKIKFTT